MRLTAQIWTILCFAMALSAAGCVQPPTSDQRAELARKHFGAGRAWDSERGFSIAVPEGYHDGATNWWHFMVYFGPQEGDFGVNFNVMVRDDPGTPAEQAGPEVCRANTMLLPDYKSIEQGFITIDDKKCYYSSGTFTWAGRNCRNLQYILRGANRKVYIITFASPVDSFPTHRPVFEKAARSARAD